MKETRTTKLFEELNSLSDNKNSYKSYLFERQKERQYSSLYDFLTAYLASHPDLTIPDIILHSNLNQNYVYPIFNGSRKHPSKYKLVALCVGMGMNLEETQHALKLAGCAELYPKIDEDAGIILNINHGCHDVPEIESFLEESGVRNPFALQ